MADERQDPPSGGWLPPVPPGGGEPAPPPAPAPPGGGAPGYAPGWGQYGPGQPPPAGPPPAHGPPGAPPPAHAPPAHGPPGYPTPGYGPPWQSSLFYTYTEPGNGTAVTGFVLSIASIGALVFFVGILAPITLCTSIAGAIVSRNGRRKVDRGETRQNRDLASWGFWLGIVGIVLSALAIAGWVALIASGELDEDGGTGDGEPAAAPLALALAAARLAAAALG